MSLDYANKAIGSGIGNELLQQLTLTQHIIEVFLIIFTATKR